MLCILMAVDVAWNLVLGRASGTGCEVKRVANRQVREMVVNFGRVDGLTPVSRSHLLGPDALVVERGLVIDVEAVRVASYGAQQRRASRTRGAQHAEHFSSIDNAFQVTQYVDSLALVAKDLSDSAGTLEGDIGNRLLEVGLGSVSVHVEVLEGDARCPGSVAIGSGSPRAVVSLCPLPGAERFAVWVEGPIRRCRENELFLAVAALP